MRKIAILSALSVAAIAVSVGKVESGLDVGAVVPAYHPKHVTGANAGSDACPPCTYGARPAVQVWINGDSDKNVAAIAKTLEKATNTYAGKEFKSWVIYVDGCEACADCGIGAKGMNPKLGSFAQANGLKNVGLAYINATDSGTKSYKVNVSKEVKNTVFVYVGKKVTAKFVNLEANDKGIAALNAAIAKVAN